MVDTNAATGKAVLLFWAPWHEDSVRLKDQVMPALQAAASAAKDIRFESVEAENNVELSEKHSVTAVPTFCLLGSDGNAVEKIEGIVEIPQVTQAVQRLMAMGEKGMHTTQPANVAAPRAVESLQDRLKKLTHSSDVVLFMKGSPDAPRCGFSRQAVEMLSEETVEFGSFDILSDDEVRQGLKEYSDWPTYPQLYVKGELVGGLDIMKEMKSDGQTLREQLGLETAPTLEERLRRLVSRHRVMLFMKGLPSAPRCGFSRQMVDLLTKAGAGFDSFNILEDEEVRQGLKKFSDWPTYPQLYVDGDLVGGLDICKELDESGDLVDLLKG